MEVGGWGTMLMPLSFHNHGVLFHLLQVQHMDVATIIG